MHFFMQPSQLLTGAPNQAKAGDLGPHQCPLHRLDLPERDAMSRPRPSHHRHCRCLHYRLLGLSRVVWPQLLSATDPCGPLVTLRGTYSLPLVLLSEW